MIASESVTLPRNSQAKKPLVTNIERGSKKIKRSYKVGKILEQYLQEALFLLKMQTFSLIFYTNVKFFKDTFQLVC